MWPLCAPDVRGRCTRRPLVKTVEGGNRQIEPSSYALCVRRGSAACIDIRFVGEKAGVQFFDTGWVRDWSALSALREPNHDRVVNSRVECLADSECAGAQMFRDEVYRLRKCR